MENVTVLLAKKQSHFNKISPNCTISDALCRMSCQNTDYLIVMDDDERFLGLLTEHDIATKAIFNNRSITLTKVNQMMNTRLPAADSGDTVEDCMRLMRRFNVRYVPVFKNLNFLGVVSSDDIIQEAVSHRLKIFDVEDKNVALTYSY
ncbi:MAG TPA: CBS domain-containing protein [Chitinophagaceae bacterium]|nr:CBS domain-containing protein [Chitinophagaceae bacterium]